MENRFKPMNNVVAIFVTIAVAVIFFILFMMIPVPSDNHHKSAIRPSAGNRVLPSGLSGKTLFDMACSQCHTPPPLTHRSPEEWRILVLKMNRNMQQTGKKYLSSEEITPVVEYILSRQKPA